jgi:hypothetical protein
VSRFSHGTLTCFPSSHAYAHGFSRFTASWLSRPAPTWPTESVGRSHSPSGAAGDVKANGVDVGPSQIKPLVPLCPSRLRLSWPSQLTRCAVCSCPGPGGYPTWRGAAPAARVPTSRDGLPHPLRGEPTLTAQVFQHAAVPASAKQRLANIPTLICAGRVLDLALKQSCF